MKKIAIVTDSSSGIKQSETTNNLFVVPMPFLIDGDDYYENINLSQAEFYEKLKTDAKISTSQPSFGEVSEIWDKVLKDFDEIVYIPLSSGLSESCNSAIRYAQEEQYSGKVFVVNNQRVSVTLKASIQEAIELAKEGKSAEEIKEYLENSKFQSSIYIMVPTLKYLKKGGRITPAAAALGSLLSIKPILQIQGEKLDTYAKVMNLAQAKSRMIGAIKKDISDRFSDLIAEGKMHISIAHTNNEETALKFKEEIEASFPNIPIKFVDELPLVIACHIGPGSLAIALAKNQ